jgi:hypothetical protein
VNYDTVRVEELILYPDGFITEKRRKNMELTIGELCETLHGSRYIEYFPITGTDDGILFAWNGSQTIRVIPVPGIDMSNEDIITFGSYSGISVRTVQESIKQYLSEKFPEEEE